MTKLFEVYIMHNTCNQSNGFGSFATTGISVVGNTTLGQTTSIYIRGNSFFNYSALATGQNFIVVTNVSQSQITDNIIPGMGASGDTAGIVLTSSSNNNISRNNISNFNGTGDGAVSIKIADVGSTSNAISVNQITTTSTNPIVDNGTTTLYAQWINGDLFAASILTKTLKLQGSSYFFGGTAAGTPPTIGGGAIIGGLFVLGPRSLPMGYNVNAAAWQDFATWCTSTPVAGHTVTIGANYPCLADSGSTGGGAPSGAAGGALGGTYPNPTLSGTTTCTNQVVTSIAAATALGTCSSVTGAMMAANTVTSSQVDSTVTKNFAGTASAVSPGAVASAACVNVPITATGVATSDVIVATFAADPSATTGYLPATTGSLYIYVYPTTNTVNFKVCNNTASSITPGSITMNWKVIR
jgi:hypothetical protein